jgi:hypothetical protein
MYNGIAWNCHVAVAVVAAVAAAVAAAAAAVDLQWDLKAKEYWLHDSLMNENHLMFRKIHRQSEKTLPMLHLLKNYMSYLNESKEEEVGCCVI